MLVITAALSACSYSYDVVAIAGSGDILISVDPKSNHQPKCLRRIVVIADEAREPVWAQSVAHQDNCANEFPVPFGSKLKGRHTGGSEVLPTHALQTGVVYFVSVTTGVTGYGSGKFMIGPDGQIENLGT